jgi:hypothetical protein
VGEKSARPVVRIRVDEPVLNVPGFGLGIPSRSAWLDVSMAYRDLALRSCRHRAVVGYLDLPIATVGKTIWIEKQGLGTGIVMSLHPPINFFITIT